MECLKCNYKNDNNRQSCVKCGTSLTLDPFAFTNAPKADNEASTNKPAKQLGNKTFRLGLALTIFCLLYFFVALVITGMYSAALNSLPADTLKYIGLANRGAMVGIVIGLIIAAVGIWQMAQSKHKQNSSTTDEEARLMAAIKDQLPPTKE